MNEIAERIRKVKNYEHDTRNECINKIKLLLDSGSVIDSISVKLSNNAVVKSVILNNNEVNCVYSSGRKVWIYIA